HTFKADGGPVPPLVAGFGFAQIKLLSTKVQSDLVDDRLNPPILATRVVIHEDLEGAYLLQRSYAPAESDDHKGSVQRAIGRLPGLWEVGVGSVRQQVHERGDGQKLVAHQFLISDGGRSVHYFSPRIALATLSRKTGTHSSIAGKR